MLFIDAERYLTKFTIITKSLFLRFFLFCFEFMRDRERERGRQREKQAPCKEPDAGLDPGSPGPHPGLQAAPNRCATRAALNSYFLKSYMNKKGF